LIIDEVNQGLSAFRRKGMAIVDIGNRKRLHRDHLGERIAEAKIYATDVSAAALLTAVGNAKRNID